MPSLPDLLASLALLLPLGLVPTVDAPAEPSASARDEGVHRQAEPAKPPVSALPLSERAPGWSPLREAGQPRSANQVRIERRVIIRISPAPGRAPQSFAPQSSPFRGTPRQFVERPFKGCLDTAAIAAVAPEGRRLLLFTRDRQMLAAQLENACSPREFYQGFYMERSKDGKLCPRRDKLLSRSGARCSVDKLHRMVEVLPQ